jgi:asparagine N-glycosylation enzyme membrane subunit Stt3
MVQRLIGFFVAATALMLLLYAAVRESQRTDEELSPVRRAVIFGGIAGITAFLALLAWWAWIAPPT